MDNVRVGISGITGRMGRALVRAALETPGIALGAASSHSQDELVVGQDAGLFAGGPESGVAISGSLEYCRDDFDVAIDFTHRDHTLKITKFCTEHDKGLVIGTTAHEEEHLEAIRRAAEKIPVVMAPNMSIGINLMLNLITESARVLGEDADVDLVEAHHRKKYDAPSGTALALGKAVARGRGQDLSESAVFETLETGHERDPKKIHFHIMRQADMIGEHRVIFALNGERLELLHQAGNRHIYANGALRAARWTCRQSPGLYTMQDVLAV